MSQTCFLASWFPDLNFSVSCHSRVSRAKIHAFAVSGIISRENGQNAGFSAIYGNPQKIVEKPKKSVDLVIRNLAVLALISFSNQSKP